MYHYSEGGEIEVIVEEDMVWRTELYLHVLKCTLLSVKRGEENLWKKK